MQYLLGSFTMICLAVLVYVAASIKSLGSIISSLSIQLYLIYYPLEIGYAITMAYAIIYHGALDIRTVIHKTLLWLLTSSAAVLPAALSFWFLRHWLIEHPAVEISLIVAFSLGLLVYARHVQPRIDHLFQRRKYDMQKILQGMVKELVQLKDLPDLTQKIASTIHEALYVSRSSILLWEEKKGTYSVIGEKVNVDPASHDSFLNWMKKENRVIDRAEIEADPRHDSVREPARRYFEAFGAKLALPLLHDGSLIGVIHLGEKDTLKSFTSSDIAFLADLRMEASIALSNSLLYENVQQMTRTLGRWAKDLEKKVAERTEELTDSKAELERSYQKLQEVDRLKTDFFANISHELRTPLTLILAPLESWVKTKEETDPSRGPNGDPQRPNSEQAGIMYQNGLRLLKLINNLLDLAKIDAGKMRLSYSKTDFVPFARGIIASISSLAEKKGITLSFTCTCREMMKLSGDGEGGDRCLFNGFYFDRDKIEKVLLNLIFNAIKFTDSGGKVTVSCERQDDQVQVKVSDTGIGIAKENLHLLFSRFTQVDSASNRRYEGTGIGLALAKELVELHKGEIGVESEPGKGTTIAFTLPYLENPICLPEEPGGDGKEDWTRSLHRTAEYSLSGIAEKNRASEKEAAPSRRTGPKILIVEDNPDMLRFLTMELQGDYEVVTAQNGQEGIEKAKGEFPALILSDVMMPIKDGYQLCREVKEGQTTKQIPVILMSAKADLSKKIEGLEQGADDYLAKPFSFEELRARVKSLLQQRGLESQLVHSEKMAAVGLLVGGLAHEINNPVTFAKVSLENLRGAIGSAEKLIREGVEINQTEINRQKGKIDRALSIIGTALDRTQTIISDLKAFIRKDDLHFRPTDLHEGLDSTLNLMQHDFKERIEIVKEYGEIGPVEAVGGQINQVFMNLLQNAAHAIPGKGEIRIKTWRENSVHHELSNGKSEGAEPVREWVKVSIKDSGVGIPSEQLKRIFEPFYTTKEVGKGTGLGLSVSDRIIQNHGGKIAVTSRPGEGTEFILTLPALKIKQTVPTPMEAVRD
ncbi:MAG: ATP-binding protein [Candidatus Manganitrophaceae bacterium]